MAPPRRTASKSAPNNQLSALLSPEALELLNANGIELLQQIGLDVVRKILLDILSGRNLRDTTELITRRRIAALNLALLAAFAKLSSQSADLIARLPYLAADILSNGRLAKSERWLAQWILGLTDKGVQNILRDDAGQILTYRDQYVAACADVIASYEKEYGSLSGLLRLGTQEPAPADWLFFTYLLNTIGAQTLTIRGSGKSAYGKLFERLVLGSLLNILGFSYQPGKQGSAGSYWLSSSIDAQRESDATLIYELGKGVRFDIGFIGRGNPEIMLDKVGRFRRNEEISGRRYYMATLVLVDRIPPGGRLRDRAAEMDGDIVQMSAHYSPQEVARVLHRRLGFVHPLVEMPHEEIENYLRLALQTVPLTDFFANLPDAAFAETAAQELAVDDE